MKPSNNSTSTFRCEQDAGEEMEDEMLVDDDDDKISKQYRTTHLESRWGARPAALATTG
jgi:hypothetical protein